MKISKEEYEKRLKDFLLAKGPNPGNGFFGQLFWELKMTKEFKRKNSQKQNVVVDIDHVLTGCKIAYNKPAKYQIQFKPGASFTVEIDAEDEI